MKKIFIFTMLLTLMLGVNTMNAQQKITKYADITEGWYVGLEGGLISPMKNSYADQTFKTYTKQWRSQYGVELGKNFTPQFGMSVEFLGAVNTTPANSWFDQTNLKLNTKFNLSNIFGGYKGQPRTVEFVLVPGLGWGHNYKTGLTDYNDFNYLTYNTNLEVNFNLGKEKAWQINLKPGFTYATRKNDIAFNVNRGAWHLLAGVTYKFKSNKSKSHNFVQGLYYTDQEYNELAAQRDELANRPPKTVEKAVEKVVEKPVYYQFGGLLLTFPIGKYTLSNVEQAKLERFANEVPEGCIVNITGSADTETGSKARNEYLAVMRAKTVQDYLNGRGIKTNVDYPVLDIDKRSEASRAALTIIKTDK